MQQAAMFIHSVLFTQLNMTYFLIIYQIQVIISKILRNFLHFFASFCLRLSESIYQLPFLTLLLLDFKKRQTLLSQNMAYFLLRRKRVYQNTFSIFFNYFIWPYYGTLKRLIFAKNKTNFAGKHFRVFAKNLEHAKINPLKINLAN